MAGIKKVVAVIVALLVVSLVGSCGDGATNDEDVDDLLAGLTDSVESCPERDGDWRLDDVSVDDFVSWGAFKEMAASNHDLFERVVLRFGDSPDDANFNIKVEPGPAKDSVADAEEHAPDVAGSVMMYVTVSADSNTDSNSEDFYSGPRDIFSKDIGTTNLQQVHFGGGYEGMDEWIIGFNEVRSFRALTLNNPSRLVLDICK